MTYRNIVRSINLAHHRNLDAEELVALTVLALAGFEETAQVRGLLRVLTVKNFLVEGGGVVCFCTIFFARHNRIFSAAKIQKQKIIFFCNKMPVCCDKAKRQG